MKRIKPFVALAATTVFALPLMACSSQSKSPTTNSTQDKNPIMSVAQAQSGKKPVVLVVSFGTSYNETRKLTIDAIETTIAKANPEREVRRAFTSQIIIDKLKKRDNLAIDNVTEAMNRLVADGITDVIIQPTHILNGLEYDDVIKETEPYKAKFASFKVGQPLLMSDQDYAKVVEAMDKMTKADNVDGTAIVWMGHGTEHKANAIYSTLQQKLKDQGLVRHVIGTVENKPTLQDALDAVKKSGAKTVILRPFMIVAGDHATNDMASDEPNSWKVAFQKAGYEVKTVLKGLAEDKAICDIFVQHTKEAK